MLRNFQYRTFTDADFLIDDRMTILFVSTDVPTCLEVQLFSKVSQTYLCSKIVTFCLVQSIYTAQLI